MGSTLYSYRAQERAPRDCHFRTLRILGVEVSESPFCVVHSVREYDLSWMVVGALYAAVTHTHNTHKEYKHGSLNLHSGAPFCYVLASSCRGRAYSLLIPSLLVVR